MFPWEEEEVYYRHKVEVHLAFVAVNIPDSSQTRFAIQNSDQPSLPFLPLKRGGDTFETAKRLFSTLSGFDHNPWYIIKQVGVYEQIKEDTLIILYTILIPEVIPLLDNSVSWVDFETLSKHPTLLNMIGVACNYYKAGH